MKTQNRQKSLKAILISILVAAVIATVMVYAAEVAIDDFSEGSQGLTVDQSSQTARDNTGSHTSIVGGYRDVYVEWGGGTTANGVAIDVNTTDETVVFSAKSNMTGTAEISWDGDSNASSLSYSLSEDLTDSGSNTGILLRVLKCDHDTQLTFTGYDSSGNYDQLTRNVSGIGSLNYLDIFYPFNDFVSTGTGADWTNLGALVFKIDGTLEEDLDVTVDLIKSTGDVREYGDLPDGTGGTPDYSDGDNELAAYHSNPQGLTLGYNLDHEISNNTSNDTSGDDNDNYDDEDGLTSIAYQQFTLPIPPYTTYYQYVVNITINGCTNCWLNGWIDLDSSGDFDDTAPEHFINDENKTASGVYQGYIYPPSSDGYYYLRLRVCDADGECDSPSENATNGEVEDYRLYLNPTAVELSAFTAQWIGDAVEIAWTTDLEIDTMGFNLWRSTDPDDGYVQVNDALIPSAAPGSTEGGAYAFTDDDVAPGTTYYYKLEEIEAGGVSNWYGPATASTINRDAATPNRVTLTSLAAGRGAGWLLAAASLLALGGAAVWQLQRRRVQ